MDPSSLDSEPNTSHHLHLPRKAHFREPLDKNYSFSRGHIGLTPMFHFPVSRQDRSASSGQADDAASNSQSRLSGDGKNR